MLPHRTLTAKSTRDHRTETTSHDGGDPRSTLGISPQHRIVWVIRRRATLGSSTAPRCVVAHLAPFARQPTHEIGETISTHWRQAQLPFFSTTGGSSSGDRVSTLVLSE